MIRWQAWTWDPDGARVVLGDVAAPDRPRALERARELWPGKPLAVQSHASLAVVEEEQGAIARGRTPSPDRARAIDLRRMITEERR